MEVQPSRCRQHARNGAPWRDHNAFWSKVSYMILHRASDLGTSIQELQPGSSLRASVRSVAQLAPVQAGITVRGQIHHGLALGRVLMQPWSN